jgi:hypothetical protein
MTEKNMQTFFGKYLQKNLPVSTEVYELKICKGKSLPFNMVKDHQIEGLLKAETGLYHKITDFPMFAGSKIRFNRPKPFDCICFNKASSFIIIWFYIPRAKKVFYKIKIKDFLKCKETAERKSITEEMASKIGTQIWI